MAEKCQILRKEFTYKKRQLNLYIFVGDKNVLWFKANDVAIFFGHSYHNNVIKSMVTCNNWVKWSDLKMTSHAKWSLNTIMINKLGLYQLIVKTKNPIARHFENWFNFVLLTSISQTFKDDEWTINNHIDVSNIDSVSGHVYVITNSDYAEKGIYYIGKTLCLEDRLQQFNDISIYPFYYIYSIRHRYSGLLKTYLYDAFSDQRIAGNFFKLNSLEVDLLKQLCSEYILSKLPEVYS